jgi:serine/threonine protein kinase
LPQSGEQFGHYRIVRLLGQGGMGAAFEAEDMESGRRVALKVLSHTLDSPEARERFFREGRLAASINHPNSVYVFGTEEIGGTPVIAMELVSGGTLQDRVAAQGPLPVGQAVDCVLQIIAGLEAAQRIGILHRDIKPSNCFRDADGAVKVGDFGLSISTAVRTEPALTATGAFLGTPAFCSPEQLRGDELNARSDMYSVGATLFFLLTGRTPFEGKTTVQLLATVLEQRAPSPRKFRANVPQGLAKAVLRCLEKQPGERFKNYRELATALAPYSSAAPGRRRRWASVSWRAFWIYSCSTL